MIRINNRIINTSYHELLKLLKLQVGNQYLREIKEGQDNIQITCPFHKEGQEKKASAGVSLKDGVFHCFTCGKVVSFSNLVSYCLHYDNESQGEKWIINNSEVLETEQRNINGELKRDEKPKEYVSESELENYRYYHPYMFQRKLTKEIISKFDVGYDKDTNSITFPVRDKKGNCLFIARRRVDYKYFNYPAKVEKPLYGIYELDKNAKTIIICESIINCLTCYVYGKEAIALNGTGTAQQIIEISKLPVRVIYLGLDNDEAGDKGCYRIFSKLKDKFIFYRIRCPEGKDINDLTEEEFKQALKNASKIV